MQHLSDTPPEIGSSYHRCLTLDESLSFEAIIHLIRQTVGDYPADSPEDLIPMHGGIGGREAVA